MPRSLHVAHYRAFPHSSLSDGEISAAVAQPRRPWQGPLACCRHGPDTAHQHRSSAAMQCNLHSAMLCTVFQQQRNASCTVQCCAPFFSSNAMQSAQCNVVHRFAAATQCNLHSVMSLQWDGKCSSMLVSKTGALHSLCRTTAVIDQILTDWQLCFNNEFLPVLWRCWLGGRKGIRPVKNCVVGCRHGYLSRVRCRLEHGPTDATATHCLLFQ